MKEDRNILIQCDFDGTVTIEDASFAILDAYIPDKWRKLFKEYQDGEMTVGEFNYRAFSMVKADKSSLLDVVNRNVRVRPGFSEFVKYCRGKQYKFIIVSNGLDFYIEDILEKEGLSDIDVFASNTVFNPEGLEVRHKGPDGNYLDDNVKAAYAEYYLEQGYEIVYLGDGRSDLLPASKCHYVFATGSLVDYCREANLPCTPFENFNDIVEVMEFME